MFSFTSLFDLFVFKGGTCIKKCYYDDYRFSEDLDFTLLDEKYIVNEKFIRNIIKKATEISRINFHIFSFRKQIFEDKDQGYEIVLKFWGANHKKNQKPLPVNRWLDKIKLDIVFAEIMFDQSSSKSILHNYSDQNLITNQVNTYSYNEIVAEKLRALIERNRPRDIYDNWYFAMNTSSIDYSEIKKLLIRKSEYKGIKIAGIEQFINDDKRLKNKNEWISSLGNQINPNNLPDFDDAYTKVEDFIKSILNS